MKTILTFLTIIVTSLLASAENYDESVGLRYFENGQYDMALPMLQKAAKAGSLPALDALGQMYQNGLGVEANKTIMLNMYNKAIAKNHTPSIINLAQYYYSNGNTARAVELWSKGAELKSAFCAMKMGRCHELGIGVAKSLEQAKQFYHAASLISPDYKEDLASAYYAKGELMKAFDLYWEIYTSGEYLSDMGGIELATLLASDKSLTYRNPAKDIVKASTSPVDMGRELNLAKAAQVWLNKVVHPDKIAGALHSMSAVNLDPDAVLDAMPQLKERIEEYSLAAEKAPGYTGAFPMSKLRRYPEMIGGDEKYADWVCYNMKYPVEADGTKASGRVVVAGVVGYDGKFMDPTIIKSATPAMNREALRLAKNMPEFKPGGMRANCLTYFAIPIIFNPDTYAPWRENNEVPADPDEICLSPDTPAEFKGGDSALRAWLAANMHYPETARMDKIQGRVVLSLEISPTGSIDNITIVRGADRDLDIEALRVARKMPAWEPARHNGKPVRTRINLPFTFKL